MPIPTKVICQHAVWKNAETQAYCVAFVRKGLELLQKGIPFFGSDDIFSGDKPKSPAIAGSSISVLRKANIIKDYFGTHAELNVFSGRRTSKSRAANGRQVNLFQIVNVGIAESFLRRNAVDFEPQQVSLF